jgi:hypothetical protein
MNFLELAARTKLECGVSGTLNTVANQTGELQRLCAWVSSAYDDICSRHASWRFLRSSFSLTTEAGKQDYDVQEFADTQVAAVTVGFAHWWRDSFRIYRYSGGISGQTWLPFTHYDSFRDIWMLGTPQQNTPQTFTIKNDDEAILLGPVPNDVYIVTGDFQRDANVLNDDTDVPLLPTRFHMAIVWLAAQRYSGFEEAGGVYQHADREFNRLMGGLEFDQLPEVTHSGPLA